MSQEIINIKLSIERPKVAVFKNGLYKFKNLIVVITTIDYDNDGILRNCTAAILCRLPDLEESGVPTQTFRSFIITKHSSEELEKFNGILTIQND